jgi:hypothetical protein
MLPELVFQVAHRRLLGERHRRHAAAAAPELRRQLVEPGDAVVVAGPEDLVPESPRRPPDPAVRRLARELSRPRTSPVDEFAHHECFSVNARHGLTSQGLWVRRDTRVDGACERIERSRRVSAGCSEAGAHGVIFAPGSCHRTHGRGSELAPVRRAEFRPADAARRLSASPGQGRACAAAGPRLVPHLVPQSRPTWP